MKMKPKYAENIIVGIVYKHTFKWYVTDRELWFLDYNKLDKAYGNFDMDNTEVELDERKNIKVLDENSVEEFLLNINKYLYNRSELQSLLINSRLIATSSDELLDFSPSLYINFDKKMLISLFPEPASYEDFVPSGWEGRYEDFTKCLNIEDIYWLDEYKNNLLIMG